MAWSWIETVYCIYRVLQTPSAESSHDWLSPPSSQSLIAHLFAPHDVVLYALHCHEFKSTMNRVWVSVVPLSWSAPSRSLTSKLTISNYICNSLDCCLQVQLFSNTISDSNCICKLTWSLPPRSHNHGPKCIFISCWRPPSLHCYGHQV